MYIDKFKKDGYYVDKDGAQYEDATGFIHSGLMGFCGCGMPEDSLRYVREGMRILRNLQSDVDKDDVEDHYRRHKEACKAHFGSDGAEYFFWYWLNDTMEWAEHGGSVPGWLTETGEAILADLEQLDLEEETCTK